MRVLQAVEEVNENQKSLLFDKLVKQYNGNLEGKTVALWGLAFKPETDDMREAPALVLIDKLLKAGCKVRAFAAKCNLIVVTGYGFAWSRKRLKIKNVVSINAAKNNEAACVLHIRDVHKMRHRVRVARALLFFILHVHLSMTYLCHHQVIQPD